MEVKTFDLPMMFPAGINGSSDVRRRLEMGALDKLREDLESQGYEALSATFRVVWDDPVNGTATIEGIKR